MKCSDFERRLEQYQAGTLLETERRETDQHLCQCASCRALLEALQLGENRLGRPDLSQAVLSRTTGSACGRCRSLLGDLLDGILEGVENELVASHLEACTSCNSLFRAMSELAEVLPQMREMAPDSSFVPEVLRSTRALRHDRLGLSRILEFFRGLAERPRFSWEAAYLGTLLVFGLFGTPFSPVHDASSRLLASLQNPEGLIVQADSSLQRWRQEAQIAIGASDRARQTVSRMTARSAQTAELMVEQGRNYIRQSEAYLGSAGKALQARIVDVYRQAKGSKTAPKR